MSLVRNRILTCMPPEAFELMRPHFERVSVGHRTILQEQFRPIEHVHFIERGVASVFVRTGQDGPVEVSLIGRFGMVGVSAILGANRSPYRCIVQVGGETLRMPAAALATVMDESRFVRHHLLNYVHVLMIQNSQLVLCNGRHDVIERLARWLLLARDRLDEDVVPVTHDILSILLGVRRAGITEALAGLEQTGAVRRERGAVRIVDRQSLEKRSCECYRIIAAEFQRLGGTNAGRYTLEGGRAEPCL